MKVIFISIPIGRSIKYFLDTKLYSLLKEKYFIFIFSPVYSSKNFLLKYGGENVLFFDHPGIDSRSLKGLISRIYMKFRLYHSAFRLSSLKSSQILLHREKRISKYKYYMIKTIYMILKIFSGWQIIKRLRNWIFLTDYYNKFFLKEKPFMVISTAPCKLIEDYCLQACALKFRVPLIFFPESWDNFTRNGEFPYEPSKIFSWGKEMSQHAKDLFGFRDNQIVNIGMIRLEKNNEKTTDRNEFRFKMNIPNGYNVILFPSNQPYIIAVEPILLEELIEDINHGKLGKVILIIRLNNIHGEIQKWYAEKYRTESLVRINIPEIDGYLSKYSEADISWDTVLSNVDLVITICSMIVLEAFNWDKPVINLNYDYGIMNKDGLSYKSYYQRKVYEKIIKLGATTFVNSREEMNKAVLNYLKNPYLHRENRKKVMEYWDVEPSGGLSRSRRALNEIDRIISERGKLLRKEYI